MKLHNRILKTTISSLLALLLLSDCCLPTLAIGAANNISYTNSTETSIETTDPGATSDTVPETFEYTLNETEKTVTLTKYIGSDSEVVIADAYTINNDAYRPVLDCATIFRGNTTITSVTIGSGAMFKDDSMSHLFAECTKLTNINLSSADTSSVTDMSYLFFKCTALQKVDLTGLDTDNVTTMRGMFSYCTKLIDLSGYENWDTSSLEVMYHMFNRMASGAGSIDCIDLSNWDLSNIVNSGWCFQLCYAKQILLPENLKTMSAGFLNHASKITGTSFTIPAGVEKIGYAHTIYDFATDDFVEFVVADGNTNYKTVDGILYSADGTEMLAVPRNKTFQDGIYEIPEGVTFLGELSFSRNYNINTVVLPDSYVIEYVPLYNDAYIVFEDTGNLNHGTNLSIAIYCYTGITEYAVKDSNTNYASQNGIIYSKDMTELVAIPSRYAQMIEIPEGVTKWNYQASWTDDLYPDTNSTVDSLMKNCTGVSIPASLTDISQDQIDKLNRINTNRAGTDNPFTITVATGNTAFELDEDGNLCRICAHTYENGVCTGCGSSRPSLAGKTISILGDSISTYTGVSNNAAYNSTLTGGSVYYSAGTLGVNRADTWWQQTIDTLDMELLVNNSWSGSCVMHTRSGTVGAYLDRCVQLHNDTTGEEPDVIAVFLGTNDFSYYQSALGSADIDYTALITDNGDGTYTYTTPNTTCEAYAIMLHKMTERYPAAEIYCLGLTARRNPDKEDNYADVGQPTAFNAELKEVIEYLDCTYVDLENCGIDAAAAVFDTYMGDGRVHPNAAGMDQISLALIDTLMGTEQAAHIVSYTLTNVTADTSGGIVLSGDSHSANLTAAAGFDEMVVSVTMGDEDITASAWINGTLHIPSVTADVVVTAVANIDDTPDNFRWEMSEDDLVCTTGGNALTRKAGTVTDGVINNAYYSLETPVILRHGQPWVVEWKASGSWSGMIFSANSTAAVTGNNFLFKTTSTTGFIGFGERVNNTYENYGVALTALGIDTSVEHIYKVENRIAADGTNMAHLFVDGTEIGPMDNFFIGGTNDQNQTINWLNGRDFCFSYMGASSHTINNCKLDYIAVWEGGENPESLPLRYDDHYDVSGKTVEILDAGTPTSYQVGYGVEKNTVLDTAVVTMNGDNLVATGIGTAKVRIDGTLYEVSVTSAPISLILLAGQSMMQGSEGNADQSIVCPDGMVYATYGDRYNMTVNNAANYAASALTGVYSSVNANGTTTDLNGYPIYSLNEAGAGKMGPDSGIAYQWAKGSGEKIWIVNAAHGGSSITTWQSGGANYEECILLFSACQETLRKEIAAGHFTLSHMGCFWRQGAADEQQSAEWYIEKFLAMWANMKADLSTDMDGDGYEETLEFIDISMEMAGHIGKTGYRYASGVYDHTDSSMFSTYEELEMRGHRVAQYWMSANPDLQDINLVCNADANWLTMPDDTTGVAEYFAKHYTNGKVDYTVQVEQNASWYTPTTSLAVKDSIHFNQIGYNEMGIECARNALILLGISEDTDEETTVVFYDWTGYREVSSIEAATTGQSSTLVVPVVYPCYRAKEVTYQTSAGLTYEYYDLIADSFYTSGTLTSVGADETEVTVTAGTLRDYRWDLENGELISTGESENTMTRLSGATEDSLFTETRYQLERPFVLRHDQEWALEWKMTGPWVDTESTVGKKLFSQDGVQTALGSVSIGTKSNEEWLAFTVYTTSGHIHYGIDLAEHSLSLSENHTYRLYNQIAEDGRNMIYLAVDGVVLGAMNTHLNTGSESDWVNGRDFVFGYLGTPKYYLDNGIIEFIQVWEGGEDTEPLPLRYDDHYDVACKTVEIVDAGTPTSYQVGYGVEENTVLDTAVVSLEGNHLVATGIGTAKVRIDGTLYEVSVTSAPISLLLLIGQSNMEGNEGDANQSIVCPDGQVYATYGDRYDMNITNATHYAPSALTGQYRDVNSAGSSDGLSDYPVYMLTDEGNGRKGPDSGFAYEWVKQTGEKVWIVNASHGGTSLNVWQPGTTQYEECQAMFGACTETLRKEIAAGHFTLSHMAYFWCQGCNDRSQTAEWYVNNYLSMHEALKTELAFDHDSSPTTADKTFEFGGIIPVRVGSTSTCYRDGVSQYTNPYAYHESFADLRFSGPRVAQYWMCNNPELEDIWLVCNIGEEWVWMPDGTNGVSDYFQAHYENGTVDYATQVTQSASWYTPTTPAAVHDSIHYNQIGYNEVGRESVRNALIYMGINPDYSEETTVSFMDWTGFQNVAEISAFTEPNSSTLVVPIVSPVTRCKDVTYNLSSGLSYDWYDLTADAYDTIGTLSAVGASGHVTVTKQSPGVLYADHLNTLPDRVCEGLNLWPILEHDTQYYTVSGWGVHGSNQVFSVTIPVTAGDHIWATSMGVSGSNGTTATHGIRVTFFGEYGVICTMSPGDVYAEFAANGYLTAPEGTTAVNIPMWNNSDENELFLLSQPHDQTDLICSICGKDSHDHSFSDWETVTLPSPDGPGTEMRSCTCGKEEMRSVDGVWQAYNLGEYLIQLPESYCAETNLWSILEHNEYYYHSGTHWGIHESGTVYSVTIPIGAEDKIYATSFGQGGINGIRVTFFDIYGVAKTMSPTETYAEFTTNGGYLSAPEGAIAVNIPMWNNSDENEIYILNRSHSYSSTVTSPTCTEPGYTSYICSICGDSYTDGYVDASGHIWSQWHETTAPTYTEDGEARRDCTHEDCEAFETRIVSSTGPALIDAVSIEYQESSNTLLLHNVPKELTVVLALYEGDQMVTCDIQSDASGTVSYTLPSGQEIYNAKLFFLTQTWQPIAECKSLTLN